jgi:hypothetical protein
MSLILSVRFAAYGRSSPIIVAEKVFHTEYGRYGDEAKSYEVHIKHYEQMDNTLLFSDVADRIDEIITKGKLKGVKILADYTEIGKAAIDDLREKRVLVTPLAVTDSEKETVNIHGGYNVPVRDMVAVAQRLLVKKRLKFAAGIEGAETLADEVAATYRDDSQYSDAALLLCMVTWWADRFVAEYKRNVKIPKAGRL